jgi:hypothetical protein
MFTQLDQVGQYFGQAVGQEPVSESSIVAGRATNLRFRVSLLPNDGDLMTSGFRGGRSRSFNPRDASRERRAMRSNVFAVSLMIGLGWGVAAATSTVVAAVWTAVVLAPGATPTQFLASVPIVFAASVWALICACVFAIFPIGPTAAALAWPLYRARVASRWAYAAAGTVSSATAPALVLVVEAWNPQLVRLSDLIPFRVDNADLIVASWFASVGTFAGYMAGRRIECALTV